VSTSGRVGRTESVSSLDLGISAMDNKQYAVDSRQ
jgi:hypothetical protein